MANDEHVAMLRKGVAAWNAWRDENRNIHPDLSNLHWWADLRGAKFEGANLSEANLRGAYLRGRNLSGANLKQADLSETNLEGANLTGADLNGAKLERAILEGANLEGANLYGAELYEANLTGANLKGANLSKAFLTGADLYGAHLSGANLAGANVIRAYLAEADLRGANLNRANLERAVLVETNLTGADLTASRIYGLSAWGLNLERTKQQNLIITREVDPEITVDNIEVAQFIYLLLHNEKIRDVIDTVGKKGVLLLGRFTEGRMVVLERLRDKLRDLGFVPMVFNFDKPETKDFTETVRLLASLSKFVIVDITNPRSAPLELQATVPDYMVPFAPILQQGEQPFSMFVDLQNKYDWVLQPVVGYPSVDRLIEVLEDKVVRPAEAKFNQLLARRTNQLRVENV
jgi:uncharacterized protein YjbI with pentapeptide repeats